MNNRAWKKARNTEKNAGKKGGITLANKNCVKKSITYREITVAIGILVALVIALTFWATGEREDFSGSNSTRPMNIPAVTKKILETAVNISIAEFTGRSR
jgi:flagellar basal body-associated protein FliL